MTLSLFLVAAGLVLASPAQAKPTQQPHPINNCFHNPLDLSVERSMAEKPIVANPQVFVVSPPRPLDPSLLNEPDVVRWPTVYRLEWDRLQGQYIIAPCRYAKK
jgi:hypothetical protein